MSKILCNEGLDDRCRDQNGQIRAKNGSTLVRTLRETYGEDFAPGVRSDMKIRHAARAHRRAVAHRAAQEALITRAARFGVATESSSSQVT
jgi:hypothetical protein